MPVSINEKIIGIMLIELMISVLLSMLLLGLLLEIYVNYQRHYQLQQSLNMIQRNSEIATDVLRTEIHKAGRVGCGRLTVDFPVISFPPYSLSSTSKIVVGHSQLTVKYMAFPNVILKETMKDKSVLTVSGNMIYSSGDILIVSSCSRAEIFVVKSVHINKDNQVLMTSNPLHDLFEKQAEVSRLEINRFYLAKSKHGDGNSLYVEDIKHRQMELVEGIANLEIETKMDAAAKITGIQFRFDCLSALLHKTWYTYIALQEVEDAKIF